MGTGDRDASRKVAEKEGGPGGVGGRGADRLKASASGQGLCVFCWRLRHPSGLVDTRLVHSTTALFELGGQP